MFDYKSFYEQSDAAIKGGRSDEVAKQLSQLLQKNPSRVPRLWRLPLAQISRRVGLFSLGLTLLQRIVFPKKVRAGQEASHREMAEYGILLLRAGITRDAEQILARVDTSEAPEALQYRALVHLTTWDLSRAVDEFRAFLDTNPAPSAALIAQVNLAATYLKWGKPDGAKSILSEALSAAKSTGYLRLERNCLAFLAQMYIQRKEYVKARAAIDAGEQMGEMGGNTDQWQFLKWKLILDALEGQSFAPLAELKKRAEQNHSWDDVRLADLYSLHIRFDWSLFLHLYFGTPYEGFRQRLVSEFGRSTDRLVYYVGDKKHPRFDLRTGEIDGLVYPDLAPGGKTHQLIEVLMRDFYQPMRTPEIYSELFPGERYDPDTAPNRVHAIISRARKALRANRIPIEIREVDGFYDIKIKGKMSFLIHLKRQSFDGLELHFDRLRLVLADKEEFRASEACEKLRLARQTVQRIINWALARGFIERRGSHKDVTYRWIPDQNQQAKKRDGGSSVA